MQQSKAAGSVRVIPSYSLRTFLIIFVVLAAGSGSLLSYYIVETLQAVSLNEAVWVKGQVIVWLLWTCFCGFQLILGFFAWQKATPEQKCAPAIGTVPMTGRLWLWQLLTFLALTGTGKSYQVSSSPGGPIHGGTFGQYEVYFSLLLLLVWLVAFVLRSRLQRTV